MEKLRKTHIINKLIVAIPLTTITLLMRNFIGSVSLSVSEASSLKPVDLR